MRYELREYQQRAITELKKSLAKGNKKIILTLATGAGKSIIARIIAEMASKKGSEVLYTAHRTILIKQMKETFKGLSNVQCETLQTSANREHDDIKIIIADEVHYGVNSKMQDKVFAKYPDAIIIGLSATPITHAGYKLKGWDETIDIVQLADLIDLGFASNIRIFAPMDIDTSSFRTSGNDFNSKDIAEEVGKSEIVSNVVDVFCKYAKTLKTIFYCVNIQHAESINNMLLDIGLKSSTYHSKLKDKDKIFDRFKKNELQILCSVESLTTGVDEKDIYCLVLATPTKSIIKSTQIVGRATRLNNEDPNKVALILDCGSVIDSTQHPLKRLVFDKEPPKSKNICDLCKGKKYIKQREVKIIDASTGVYLETITWECSSCGNIEIEQEEQIDNINFCLECDKVIERGSAETQTRITCEAIEVFSVCPHCKNEKIVRSVKMAEKQMREIKFEDITTWDEVKEELKQAVNKEGKKYHHVWASITIDNLINANFGIEEVKDFIRFYKNKGWTLGNITTAMINRRDKLNKH